MFFRCIKQPDPNLRIRLFLCPEWSNSLNEPPPGGSILSKIIDGYRRQYVSFRQKMQGTAAIINPCKQSYYIQEVRGEIRRIYRPPVSASVCTKLHTLAADKGFSAQRGSAETDCFCIGCRSSAFLYDPAAA